MLKTCCVIMVSTLRSNHTPVELLGETRGREVFVLLSPALPPAIGILIFIFVVLTSQVCRMERLVVKTPPASSGRCCRHR